MADIKVTNTLFIRTWDIEISENGLDIIDPTSHGMGTAGVFGHELPALLRELNAAAEAMGVTTEAQRLRFENKQRQDLIEELLLTLPAGAQKIFESRLADMLGTKAEQ